MIKLGITGGIGSGKSYVASLLIERGVPVFDCDSQAKSLTVQDEVIRKRLVELLGPNVYISGYLNKSLLASYLFASKENALRINEIIHPRVREVFREWVALQRENGVEVVGMESAILFESGFHTEVDRVLMVHAPLDIRCSRVLWRDHTTLEQVKKRIKLQQSDEENLLRSDFIIENDGINPLEVQLDKLFSRLEAIKGLK